MNEHVLPPLLTEAEREALEAGATALSERGEFHIYRDGKTYTRAQCNQLAATLRALAEREYAAPGGSLASRKPREGSVAKPLRQNHPMWDLLQAYGDACQDMGEHQGLQQIAHREADVASVNAAWDALWAYIEHPADVPLPPSAGEE